MMMMRMMLLLLLQQQLADAAAVGLLRHDACDCCSMMRCRRMTRCSCWLQRAAAVPLMVQRHAARAQQLLLLLPATAAAACCLHCAQCALLGVPLAAAVGRTARPLQARCNRQ
jgi:hypothetical protein